MVRADGFSSAPETVSPVSPVPGSEVAEFEGSASEPVDVVSGLAGVVLPAMASASIVMFSMVLVLIEQLIVARERSKRTASNRR